MEQSQIDLELMFNKKHVNELLKAYYSNLPGLTQLLDKIQYPQKFALKLLSTLGVSKSASPETIVSIMINYVDTIEQLTELLEGAVFIGLAKYDQGMFKVNLKLPDSLDKQIRLFMYPMPMVCEPKELISNSGSAYLTVEKDSVLLNDSHHSDDIVLEHLNKMNKVSLSLNQRVVDGAVSTWKNAKTADALKQLSYYNQTAKVVHKILLDHGNKFYLTHKYDKRGRCYCQGYHVSYQGSDFNKAIIEFTNKELIK